MKVGYLGPKGTFSYEAAKNYCKNGEELIEYKTIPETILALKDKNIEKAVVPIENSLQGCVTDAIDTLIQNEDLNVYVIDEIMLEIRQNLIAKKEIELKDIKKVYSHPQAISQCSNFIEKNLKGCEVIPVESTAGAAKKVQMENEEDIACIGNASCVNQYNLKLLKEDIQDNSSNKTRFWILSRNKEVENPKKMSIIFSVKDKPGALYNVLKIFNKYNLNLTKIESRPAKTVLGEYIFWIDVTMKDSNENKAIKEIQEKNIYIKILGKY